MYTKRNLTAKSQCSAQVMDDLKTSARSSHWGVNLVKTAILFKLSNSVEQSERIEQIHLWLEQAEVSACRGQRGLGR